MKAAKWRDMSDDELQQKRQELGEELFNLRFQLLDGVAKNPARVARSPGGIWRGPRPFCASGRCASGGRVEGGGATDGAAEGA